MAEVGWLEWIKLLGLAGVPLLIVAGVTYHMFKFFLPQLLADHRSAMEAQRQDFLKALEQRDTAETDRATQRCTVFERRIDAHISANRELVQAISKSNEVAMKSVVEELRSMKRAIESISDLVVAEAVAVERETTAARAMKGA